MRVLAALTFVLVGVAPAWSQQISSAEDVLARFVELNNSGQFASSETTALYTADTPVRDDVELTKLEGGDLMSPNRIVLGPDFGVARVPVKSEAGHVLDYYFNLFETAKGWRIQSVRMHPGPGPNYKGPMPYTLASTPETAASLNETARGSLDEELIDFFKVHRPAFERLANLLPSIEAAEPRTNSFRNVDRELASLSLPLGYPTLSRHEGSVLIMWGTFLGGGGGFIRASAGEVPSIAIERRQIEHGEIAWIEPLTGGWYFIRTSDQERILRGSTRTPVVRLQPQPSVD